MGFFQDLGKGVGSVLGGITGVARDAIGGLAPDPVLNKYKGQEYQFDNRGNRLDVIEGKNTNLFNAYARNAQKRAAPQMSAADIETAQQNEIRARQMGLADTLLQRIAGEAPSPAELQAREGIAQAVANARSLAAGATSGNRALANKQAMDVAAGLGQKANADAAILRAQEGQAAENSLGQVLGTGRTQDIGLATSQAGLDQGASTENLRAALETQKQVDTMVQYYLTQGFTRDQAEQRARLELESLRAGEHGRVESLAAGVSAENAKLKQQAQSLPYQIAGGVVGAAAG